MRRLYLIPFLLLSMVVVLPGQQLAQYSLYSLNPHHVNPAYAGLENSLVATGVFRKQWVDLEGSPTSQQLNAHLPLYIVGGGIGLNLENDILGAERTTTAVLSYNYWVPVSKKSFLSIGIGAGVMQKALDGSKLRAPEGTYEGATIFHNDNQLPIGLETAIAPIVNAGIFYQSERVDVGFSVKNVLESKVGFQLEQATTELSQKRHYYGFAATRMDISRVIEFIPSVLVQSDLQQTQVELTTILRYNGNIFGGGGIRGYNKNTLDAVVFLAGLKLNEKTTLAYAYDLTLSGLNAVSSGSHEIIIQYNLNKSIGGGVPPPIIHNPRFL